MDDSNDEKSAAKEDQKTPVEKDVTTDALADMADDEDTTAEKSGQVLSEDGVADDDDDEVDLDSLSDASDHAWDSDTLAAVARTTHHQMIKRQPILIGCNRDGSINVQLPNGNIIVAERSAFPKFDKTGPMEKRRQAQRIKKDQFAYLARKDKAYTDQIPRTWEIEHFLNLNASSVFHVFDRRVNVRTVVCSKCNDLTTQDRFYLSSWTCFLHSAPTTSCCEHGPKTIPTATRLLLSIYPWNARSGQKNLLSNSNARLHGNPMWIPSPKRCESNQQRSLPWKSCALS
jgi:hypothetical protein